MIQFLNNTFRPIELNYELIVTDRFYFIDSNTVSKILKDKNRVRKRSPRYFSPYYILNKIDKIRISLSKFPFQKYNLFERSRNESSNSETILKCILFLIIIIIVFEYNKREWKLEISYRRGGGRGMERASSSSRFAFILGRIRT